MTEELTTPGPGPIGDGSETPVSATPPGPPPLWDVLTFKAAGALTLMVGLTDPWFSGSDRDWKIIGLGMVMLGGRELVVRVAVAIAGKL